MLKGGINSSSSSFHGSRFESQKKRIIRMKRKEDHGLPQLAASVTRYPINSNELESRTRRLQAEVFAKSFGPHKVTGGCSSAIQPRRVCSPEYGVLSGERSSVIWGDYSVLRAILTIWADWRAVGGFSPSCKVTCWSAIGWTGWLKNPGEARTHDTAHSRLFQVAQKTKGGSIVFNSGTSHPRPLPLNTV